MSRWTHLICGACWVDRHPGRAPVTVQGDGVEPCCYCGEPTPPAIYVRDDPADLACHGEGPAHL